MLLIFDLDDTLYPERSYVDSGLRCVARHLEDRFGWESNASFEHMIHTLNSEGRGLIFDRLLQQRGALSRKLLKECIDNYRHHRPTLTLYPESAALLASLDPPLYLVTDGHKLVQQRKIEALGIEPMFSKSYLTNRYGRHRAKPDTYCFELIRQREGCDWAQMAYVGDNPVKDFVNLNRLGAHTVRVLTGNHKDVVAARGYDAQHTIRDLTQLMPLLSGLFNEYRINRNR